MNYREWNQLKARVQSNTEVKTEAIKVTFEFKKWGNGSNVYEVIEKQSYNPITKTFRYQSLGMVQKEGKNWVSLEGGIIGKTRKEVAEKMAGRA